MSQQRLDPEIELTDEVVEAQDGRSPALAYLQNIYRSRRTAGRTALVIIFVAIFSILLIADGVYSLTKLRASLMQVAASLNEAQEAVVVGDLPAAEEALLAASEAADEASASAGRPGIIVAGYLPLIGNDASVIRGLTKIGQTTAQAGLAAVDAADTLGARSRGQLARSLYRDGRIQLDRLEMARGDLIEARDLFALAEATVQALPDPNFGRLEAAVTTATARISQAGELLDRAGALIDVLPSMMGAEGPRNYFTAFVSNSQLRPAGGFIGLYGIIQADDGRSRLITVSPFDLPQGIPAEQLGLVTRPEDAPVLGRGGLTESTVNSSPSFPDVARNLLRLYERTTDQTLDGVLQVDPVALGYLTRATGPLRARGLNTRITPDNAAEVILHDAYIEFWKDPVAQSEFLMGVIQDLWSTLEAGQVDGAILAEAFGQAGRSQHLKIFSTDPAEQQALQMFGLDGGLTDEPENLQFVYQENLSGRKIDYFLRRDIETKVSISDGGFALVKTDVSLTNDAPEQLPLGLEGSSGSLRSGDNVMRLSLLLPKRATGESLNIDGKRMPVFRGRKDGYPIISTDITVPAGETRTLSVRYGIEDAVDLLKSGGFELKLLPQGMVTPDTFSMTITPPLGYKVTGLAKAGPAERSVGIEGILDQPLTFAIGLQPL